MNKFDIDKLNYPLKSQIIRAKVVSEFNVCPDCGGCLDTGWECTKCDFDGIIITRKSRPFLVRWYLRLKMIIKIKKATGVWLIK